MEQGPKRRLLRIAQVECLPSLAPPISMDSLSSAGTDKAISLNAHCLAGRTIRSWFRFAWPARQGHTSVGRHTHTAEIQVPLNHLQTKLSTIAKTTVLSARRLKPLALKGQARHRLTWRRLCLPCQANAIYEFDLSQDLWWHFAPE